MLVMNLSLTPAKPSAREAYLDSESFRRFIIRCHVITGTIMRTHYREHRLENGRKVYYGEPKPVMVNNPNSNNAPLKVREPDPNRGKMEKELPTWAEVKIEKAIQSAIATWEEKGGRKGYAYFSYIAYLKHIREDLETGRGNIRQPLPLEISGESRPQKLQVASELPDASYMEDGAAAPLIRKERRKAGEAAKAEILRLSENGNSAGRTAARILLGGATWQKVAAAENLSMDKIGQHLDIVKRQAANAALRANLPENN